MVIFELARAMQIDRDRELRDRERGSARMASGRRHPAGPDHGVIDPVDAVDPGRPRGRAVTARPVTT